MKRLTDDELDDLFRFLDPESMDHGMYRLVEDCYVYRKALRLAIAEIADQDAQIKGEWGVPSDPGYNDLNRALQEMSKIIGDDFVNESLVSK